MLIIVPFVIAHSDNPIPYILLLLGVILYKLADMIPNTERNLQ